MASSSALAWRRRLASASHCLPKGLRPCQRGVSVALSAFLLLCIGVQILIAGVEDVLGPLLARR